LGDRAPDIVHDCASRSTRALIGSIVHTVTIAVALAGRAAIGIHGLAGWRSGALILPVGDTITIPVNEISNEYLHVSERQVVVTVGHGQPDIVLAFAQRGSRNLIADTYVAIAIR
jgi:hypothetical protein